MKRKGNILFITEIDFYPVFGGERMRTYGLLKILSNTFEHVHALTGLSKADKTVKELFPNVTFHFFDFKRIATVIRHFGYFDQFKRNRDFTAKINEVLAGKNIETAFIDYKYYGQYIGYLKSRGLKVIYGTHNVQSRIMWQKPYNSITDFLLYRTYYITHYFHERFYFKRANRIIAVSDHDAKYYARYMNRSKIVTLPNFLDESLYMNNGVSKEEYIVMTANFNAFQNEEGIKWFIQNVWNNELSGRIKLVMAGMGSKEVLERLSGKYDTTNISALGKLDDLKEIISKARLSIVPLLEGSGTRLKCIESMALKTQLISTSRGAEGIEHEGSILIADDPSGFRRMIYEVLDHDMDKTEKAWEVFMNKYSYSANLEVFEAMLETL